jgi:arginase
VKAVPTRFLMVPQWQGSSSSRAMQLMDGAAAIAGDLPSSATTTVDVPMEAGESLGTGVQRLSSIAAIRDRAVAALTELSAIGDGTIVTIGGDCGVELASVGHAVASREPGSVALVWLDAHGDLNTPDTSPSGAFHGMVVRAILGEAPEPLAAAGRAKLTTGSLVLAGTRELDEPEAAFVDEEGIRVLPPERLHTPDELVTAVESTGATAVYIHVDLDVLDPGAISGVQFPEPFGLVPDELVAAIVALRSRFELAGAGITEFAPRNPDAAADDLPVILRILGALTRPAPGA